MDKCYAKAAIAIAVAFLLIPYDSAAQSTGESTDAAKAVLERFIKLNSQQKLQTPEAKKLMTGEALQRWDTPSFGTLTSSPDKMVMISPGAVVGRVQWHVGEHEWVTDCYFYLVLEKEWRIEAMRSLAATGVLGMLYSELKDKPSRSPDEEYTYNQVKLTLQPDAVLRDWFAKKEKKLERLRRLVQRLQNPEIVSVDSKEKAHSQVVAELKSLYSVAVELKGNQNIEVTIGGITDNSVGFLFSPSDSPPPISRSDYIWVEKVSNHWYLFRTT